MAMRSPRRFDRYATMGIDRRLLQCGYCFGLLPPWWGGAAGLPVCAYGKGLGVNPHLRWVAAPFSRCGCLSNIILGPGLRARPGNRGNRQWDLRENSALSGSG